MATVRLHQFTDLHLHAAADGRLKGVATLASLEAVLAQAHSRHAAPDAVLLTGDLVQDDPAAYARVRALFGASPVPVHCIPGNHDDVGAMQAALSAAPFRYCGTALMGAWQVVMLDTHVHRSASGALSAAEFARLDAALAAEPGRHALVCLHHHPVPMGSRWLDQLGLGNGPGLCAVLDRHPQVRGVLWGHVHQAFEGERNGVRLLGTPSTCVQFQPGADDFAVDRRPPGFRWLELHEDGGIASAVEWVETATAP